MTADATITFSQQSVQPPVYVVTSLSEPPWETLDMSVDGQHTNSDGLVFKRTFANVPQGSYQYKIRIGEGHWVVDESKESATDEHGNRNNVIRVESIRDGVPVNRQVIEEQSESKNIRQATPNQRNPPELPGEPTIVVDKTNNKPVHGDDDSGEKATAAQKETHELEATDATLDKVVNAMNAHNSSATGELETAPMFRYENAPTNKAAESTAIEQIGRPSNHLSTDQISSQDGAITSPGQRNSHEDTGHLFSHEAGVGGDDDYDELSHAPLLAHETVLNGGTARHTAIGDGGELEAAPLLPYEPGFSQYSEDEITTHSGSATGEDGSEPRHHMHDDDNELDPQSSFIRRDLTDDNSDYDENEAPLLPHERDSAVISQSSSELGDDGPLTTQETGLAQEFFSRAPMFRARTDSSTLPHKLPRSDAEDENLLDPSLERFPTNRELILQRVATIGLHLPEDQTIEDSVHSPVLSVMSQACSSVDLAPVKSYASLASVPEADNSDEDGENDIDGDSSPSPIALNAKRATVPAGDQPEVPSSDWTRCPALTGNDFPERSGPGQSQIGKAERVEKTDRSVDANVNESQGKPDPDPSRSLDPSSPVTLEKVSSSAVDSAAKIELRGHQASKEEDNDSPAIAPASEKAASENKITRTSAAVAVAGIAIAAYYFLGLS